MGADSFINMKIGQFKDANEAFSQAVKVNQHMHGHGGYTGTIAEKSDFKMVTVPKGKDPYDFVQECLDNDDHFCQDKWGPAGCVEVKGKYLTEERGEKYKGKRNFHVYYFFGYASS